MFGDFSLDSVRTAHPIEVAAHGAAEVAQIRDAISYLKGGSDCPHD